MQVALITIAGYALTIIFATITAVLANSLRHRRLELDAALESAEESAELAFKRLNLIADAKEELKLCRDAATLLKAKNQVLSEVQANLKTAREQLKCAYKREGKRFVKIN